MSISTEEKERYFQETAIALRREGFRIKPSVGGRLGVWLDDHSICEVDQIGGITYRSDNIPTPECVAAKDKAYKIVCTTAEYMHILGGGADDLVGFVLCGNTLWGGDIIAAVGDTTDLVHLTDGVIIQPDSKSATDARFDSEAFTPKSDGGFLEIPFLFLCANTHLFILLFACFENEKAPI